MKAAILLLAICTPYVVQTSASGQQSRPSAAYSVPNNGLLIPPSVMRFCAAYCFTLTKNGDRYDAVRDGQTTIGSTYTIVTFERSHVELERLESDGKKATVTGYIGDDGHSHR
jgi:hypothetical protein